MKQVEMEKVLRCADVSGTSCQFVARGRTMDEILQQAGKHAVEGHGLTVTPELVEAVKARVTEPTAFEVSIHARWPDMDQNGHMRTVAYLEVAEDSRMQYFASRGYSMDTFVKQRIGPVVSGDELQYRAELRLLDAAVIRLELAGLSPDGARFRLRNTIVRADGRTAATVTSSIGWLDLAERRLTTPPDDLRRLVADLPRTADFAELPPLKPR